MRCDYITPKQKRFQLLLKLFTTGMGDRLQHTYHHLGMLTSHPGQFSLPTSVGQEMKTSQSAVIRCSWRIKNWMAYSTCVQEVKLCDPSLTCAIAKCFSDEYRTWHKALHIQLFYFIQLHYYYNTYLTALCPRVPWWAGTRKVKPIWIYWSKSAPRFRQITTPAPHHSVLYRPHALPAIQLTVSKHWKHFTTISANQHHGLRTTRWITVTECIP